MKKWFLLQDSDTMDSPAIMVLPIEVAKPTPAELHEGDSDVVIIGLPEGGVDIIDPFGVKRVEGSDPATWAIDRRGYYSVSFEDSCGVTHFVAAFDTFLGVRDALLRMRNSSLDI